MTTTQVEATAHIVITSHDHIDRLDQHPYPEFPVDEVVAIQMKGGDGAICTLGLIQRYKGDCGSDHFREYRDDGQLKTNMSDPCHPGPIVVSYITRYGLSLPALDN